MATETAGKVLFSKKSLAGGIGGSLSCQGKSTSVCWQIIAMSPVKYGPGRRYRRNSLRKKPEPTEIVSIQALLNVYIAADMVLCVNW